MGKVTQASAHLSEDEILLRIKQSKSFWRIRRWMVIHHALVSPSPAAEIALRFGVSKHTVHQLISRYNRFGPAAVETSGKAQRQRAYLSTSQEQQFLKQLEKQASDGKLTTVDEIQNAFELRLGQPVHRSTVYRLLSRHQWKKKAPRPRHIDASVQQQQAFKKTSMTSSTKR